MKMINLLPKVRQEELRYEGLFHSVALASAIAFIILLAVLVVQIGARVYLNHQVNKLVEQIEQGKQVAAKSENAELKQKIRLMNVQMNDFKMLAESTPTWSRVLLAFAAHVPEGAKIDTFTAEAASKKIAINGYAGTRDAVIELYNNINQDTENFKDINYPLENVARPADVKFNFTFYIQDSLLLKQ